MKRTHKLSLIITVFMMFLFVSSVYAHNIYVSTTWNFGIPTYGSFVKFSQPQIFDTFNRSDNFLFFDNYGIRTTSNMIITTWFTDGWFNYTTTAGTQDVNCGVEPSAIYFNDVLQTKDDTWSYVAGVTTITPAGTDVGVFFGGLEIEVNEYVINLVERKLFAYITYKGTETPVSSANCSFVTIQQTTNSSGWAEWDISEFSIIDYKSSIIPLEYPDNDLVVPLAKNYLIIQVLPSSHTLTNIRIENNLFTWSATGTGPITFKIFSIDNPYYLKINNVVKMHGDSWSKSGDVVTVTDVLGSTHDYELGFTCLPPPNPKPVDNDDDWPIIIPESLVELAETVEEFVMPNLALIVVVVCIVLAVIAFIYGKYFKD